MTLGQVLIELGFDYGWVADNAKGIMLWERQEPQPTETELIAAGWIKQENSEQ